MTNIDKFVKAKNQIQEAQNQARSAAKDAFKECTDELFSKFPTLESFGWVQYTPYFNDGAECLFSVNRDYLQVNGLESETFTTYQLIDGKYRSVPNIEVDPDGSLTMMAKSIKDSLSIFDDEDFKFIFGDHCQVTVESDEIFVDNYVQD